MTEPRFGTGCYECLRGPGVINWDFGVFRRFPIKEGMNLGFRVEALNFTNTPHFRILVGVLEHGFEPGWDPPQYGWLHGKSPARRAVLSGAPAATNETSALVCGLVSRL